MAHNDLDIDALVEAFAPATGAGRAALHARLSEPLTDVRELTGRQEELRAIKKVCKSKQADIATLRQKLTEAEADVTSVADASTDERLKEYYTQILWPQTSVAARLNHLGWLNELIVFLRTVFVPGVAVMLPVFIFLAPLILYTLVLKEPITFSKYIDMIQTSVKKAMPSMLGAPRFKGAGGLPEMAEQFTHIGLGLVMLGASIWNQISSAIHMRTIVADMRRRAVAVQTFTSTTKELAALLGLQVDCGPAWSFGALGVFGDAWNEPSRVHRLLAEAGRLDMLVSIASHRRTCFPLLDSDTLAVDDLYHPSLSANRVYNSVSLSPASKQHVLLTGPNRGGKSTLLKSLGYAVLMGQTVGIVFGRRATLPLFMSIITALSPTDTVGKMSLFEAEIEFAKSVKARIGTGKMFLMMDEIFHGTNAHDGVEASQIFLDQLYASDSSVFSIVSTHYMDLPTKYGPTCTQNMCMDASVDPTDPDMLVYTYRLIPGMNRHSSVREILRERGLLA